MLSKSTDIAEIRSAVTNVQNACLYFKNSAQRVRELEKAVELRCPDAAHSRLKQYCATRWVNRHDSIFVFLELYRPLLDVFNAAREVTLVNQLTEPQFLLAILMLCKVLGMTKGVSEVLQAKQLDLSAAVAEIEQVIETFNDWRTDNDDVVYRDIFCRATALYAAIEDNPEISIPMPCLAGRQRNRNNMPAESPHEYYKRAVWYPLLDCMLSELTSRFSAHSKLAMKMAVLLPAKCVTSDLSSFNEIYTLYGILLKDGQLSCEAEFQRWQAKWSKVVPTDRPITATEALKSCDIHLYANINTLLRIFASIPVSTATAERSFSSLRLFKTYL